MFNLVHYVTEENTEERKCETRTVGLLSSQREVHFYLSRNKDKSETHERTISVIEAFNWNEVQDRFALSSLKPPRKDLYNAWDFGEDRWSSVFPRASRSLPSWMVIFTFLLFFAFYYQHMCSEKSKLHNYKKIF